MTHQGKIGSGAAQTSRTARTLGRGGYAVAVIIGILAAIAIPKFSVTREKAFMAAAKADLRNLASQQEVYHNINYTFAATLANANFVQSEGVTVTIGPSLPTA